MKYNFYMLYNELKQMSRNFVEELNIFLAQSFFNKKKRRLQLYASSWVKLMPLP